MTRDELKAIITPEITKHFGLDENKVRDRFCDDMDEFDEMFMSEEEFTLTICDLEVGGKLCSVELTAGDGNCRCYIQYGGCIDIEKANMAMDKYDESELGKRLSIENAVESEGDGLMLTYDIDYRDEEELIKGLDEFFGSLKSPSGEAELAKLCKYFE